MMIGLCGRIGSLPARMLRKRFRHLVTGAFYCFENSILIRNIGIELNMYFQIFK